MHRVSSRPNVVPTSRPIVTPISTPNVGMPTATCDICVANRAPVQYTAICTECADQTQAEQQAEQQCRHLFFLARMVLALLVAFTIGFLVGKHIGTGVGVGIGTRIDTGKTIKPVTSSSVKGVATKQ